MVRIYMFTVCLVLLLGMSTCVPVWAATPSASYDYDAATHYDHSLDSDCQSTPPGCSYVALEHKTDCVHSESRTNNTGLFGILCWSSIIVVGYLSVSRDYDTPSNKFNNSPHRPNYDVRIEPRCTSTTTLKNEMSQYRAYFVPRATDPKGMDVIDVTIGASSALDVLTPEPPNLGIFGDAFDLTSTVDKALKEKFMAWHAIQKANMNWLKALPDCPCYLKAEAYCIETMGLFFKRNRQYKATHVAPEGWVFAVLPPSQSFHPGGRYDLRQVSDGPGQQCIYDEKGLLITHGPGAGTPDIEGPGSGISTNLSDHISEDVDPFNWALELDGNKAAINENGKYFKLYLSVRPPNPGKNCSKNP